MILKSSNPVSRIVKYVLLKWVQVRSLIIGKCILEDISNDDATRQEIINNIYQILTTTCSPP